MQSKDFKPFMAILTLVADTYGQPRLNEGAVKLYFKVLSDYSLDDISRAVIEHLKQSPYMPKPCDIISKIDGSIDDKAIRAWHKLLKAISKYGVYDSVKFDDPIIHFCIDRMGGWGRLCGMTEDELPFREKDFRELYKLGRSVDWDHVPVYFCGSHERNNRMGGYDEFIPSLVEISDDETKKLMASKIYKQLGEGEDIGEVGDGS